jgi:DNA-binding transcriptional MerR regulator
MGEGAYRIGELARLAGTTVRALRFYEERGLLSPARDAQSAYRRYGPAEVDRLQEILLLRSLGVAVRDVAPLLSCSPEERRAAFSAHLLGLRAERERLDALIETVERTLDHEEGGRPMTDEEKFEGLKHQLVEDNERRFGAEVRERFGDEAAEKGGGRVRDMGQEDYRRWRGLEGRILDELACAVRDGADPAGEAGARLCEIHRDWLGFTWPSCSAEAHRGLAESYVADERFRAYYDRAADGAATWLRDAIRAHAR